ncbi:MAG: hypothetical protein ACM3QZ_07855 [Solirubrobacterales bacterium]
MADCRQCGTKKKPSIADFILSGSGPVYTCQTCSKAYLEHPLTRMIALAGPLVLVPVVFFLAELIAFHTDLSFNVKWLTILVLVVGSITGGEAAHWFYTMLEPKDEVPPRPVRVLKKKESADSEAAAGDESTEAAEMVEPESDAEESAIEEAGQIGGETEADTLEAPPDEAAAVSVCPGCHDKAKPGLLGSLFYEHGHLSGEYTCYHCRAVFSENRITNYASVVVLIVLGAAAAAADYFVIASCPELGVWKWFFAILIIYLSALTAGILHWLYMRIDQKVSHGGGTTEI